MRFWLQLWSQPDLLISKLRHQMGPPRMISFRSLIILSMRLIPWNALSRSRIWALYLNRGWLSAQSALSGCRYRRHPFSLSGSLHRILKVTKSARLICSILILSVAWMNSKSIEQVLLCVQIIIITQVQNVIWFWISSYLRLWFEIDSSYTIIKLRLILKDHLIVRPITGH